MRRTDAYKLIAKATLDMEFSEQVAHSPVQACKTMGIEIPSQQEAQLLERTPERQEFFCQIGGVDSTPQRSGLCMYGGT